MKGISPMIAMVLLIAFTVAIGGVLSVWLTGLTSTQTTQVSNQSSSQVKCTPAISIDLVKAPVVAQGALNITFSNQGTQTIVGLLALIPNNMSAVTLSSSSISAGSVVTATVNVSSVPSFVKVTGTCSGLPVSATCENSQACWQTG